MYVQIDSLQFFVFSSRLHQLGIVGKISCWLEYTLLLQTQEWCSLSFLFDQRPPVQLPTVGKEKNFNTSSHDENALHVFFFGGGIILFSGLRGCSDAYFWKFYYVNLLNLNFKGRRWFRPPDSRPSSRSLDPRMLCIVKTIHQIFDGFFLESLYWYGHGIHCF